MLAILGSLQYFSITNVPFSLRIKYIDYREFSKTMKKENIYFQILVNGLIVCLAGFFLSTREFLTQKETRRLLASE